MVNIYTDGQYLRTTQTWHSEDSSWKAIHIRNILDKNQVHPIQVAEVGCGAGRILYELSTFPELKHSFFEGYDISPQAIELAEVNKSHRVNYFEKDLFASASSNSFDLLLVVDVFEHIPDYIQFLRQCQSISQYKVYHIPLDIHVSSLLRDSLTDARYSIGHLHYFTASTAIATLIDTGHEIVDMVYTNASFEVFRKHPKVKTAVANIPRWLFAKFSVALSARLFGGYSLLVLTK